MHAKSTPLAALALAANLVACTSASDVFSSRDQSVLSTDLTVYTTNDDITVSFSGLSGSQTDWISLARTSDPDTVYLAWQYTNGQTGGTATFVAPHLAPGEYEARAYFDWDHTQSFHVEQRSTPFTIQAVTPPQGATVAASMSSYALGDQVVINYSGLPGTATDWIAITAKGLPDTSYIAWAYTPGTAAGSVTFNNVPMGAYVARAYPQDTFQRAGESAQFTVGISSVSVSTSKAQYAPTEPISVNFSGFTLDPTDWVQIVPASAPEFFLGDWQYTNGSASGTLSFPARAVGSYEVRAYLADSWSRVATSTFTVAVPPPPTSISTDKTSYALGEHIFVSFTGLPGNQLDWIAMAPAGSPDNAYDPSQWLYLNGKTSGTYEFSGLLPGSYEVRAYLDNTFQVIVRSTFTVVGVGPALSTNASSYVTGDPVIVSYSGLPGNVDWIAIAPVASSAQTYIAWTYTQPQASGTVQFNNLPAGTWEARVFVHDSYTMLAHTFPFTISDPAP